MIRKYLPNRLPKNTEDLITLYERYVSPLTLVIGFSIDAFIIRNVDLSASALLLLAYLSLAGVMMVLLNLVFVGRLHGRVWNFFVPIFPAVIQFAFGGLFSGFVILFGQSASIGLSWLFVVILAALLIGNERFRKRYTKFSFQIGILYFGLFAFFTFALPVITRSIGTDIFILGGLLSIFVIVLFVRFVEYFARELVRKNRPRVIRTVMSIFFILNAAYFTNIIPPLPLALKAAGAYHSLSKEGSFYVLQAEPQKWYHALVPGSTVHHAPGERIYAFSAIYLPEGLEVSIVHRWMRYDETKRRWISVGSAAFNARGGREGGYRGFSYREHLLQGRWRVSVETASGRVIGRLSFRVTEVQKRVETQEIRL